MTQIINIYINEGEAKVIDSDTDMAGEQLGPIPEDATMTQMDHGEAPNPDLAEVVSSDSDIAAPAPQDAGFDETGVAQELLPSPLLDQSSHDAWDDYSNDSAAPSPDMDAELSGSATSDYPEPEEIAESVNQEPTEKPTTGRRKKSE